MALVHVAVIGAAINAPLFLFWAKKMRYQRRKSSTSNNQENLWVISELANITVVLH